MGKPRDSRASKCRRILSDGPDGSGDDGETRKKARRGTKVPRRRGWETGFKHRQLNFNARSSACDYEYTCARGSSGWWGKEVECAVEETRARSRRESSSSSLSTGRCSSPPPLPLPPMGTILWRQSEQTMPWRLCVHCSSAQNDESLRLRLLPISRKSSFLLFSLIADARWEQGLRIYRKWAFYYFIFLSVSFFLSFN